MRWTGTLALLIVTVAAGAYVSLYELRRPTRQEREAQAREVISVPPDAVTAVQIAAPSLTAGLSRDEARRWRLTAPLSARADEATLLRLLYFLHPLSAQRVLSSTGAAPLAPAAYGLEPPKATLVLTTAQGLLTLKFGDATAVGDSRYVQRNDDPTIYVVRGFVFDTLDQPLDAYRSRAVVDLDMTALARLAVDSPQGRYALEREAVAPAEAGAAGPADRWRLIEPVSDDAEAEAVSRLLGIVRGLRAERFVSDQPSPEELQRWGLAAPSMRVTMTLRDAAEPVVLQVGAAVTDQAAWRYVTVSTESAVYAVEASQLEPLWTDPSTLRATPKASPDPSPST